MHADAGSPTAIVDALLPSGERTTIRIVDGTVASVGAAALPGDVIVEVSTRGRDRVGRELDLAESLAFARRHLAFT